MRAGAGAGLAAVAVGSGAAPVLAGARDKWSRLRSAIQGDVVLPTDDGYALAKQGQFIQYDTVNPVAIAFCETPEDVRTCVLFSQKQGIPLRVRSGGHHLNGWSTGEGLVIDVGRIGHATVTGSTVRVGPGAQSVDALSALAPLGKQIVTGTCPTVRAGGFVSGGGVGFQTRKFGTASDRVVSAKVVLADGRIVRCCPETEPDLYWAVRGGGGGNFGIVVDFEVRPIDAPRLVTYTTMWSWDDAPAVLAAWQAWMHDASRDLGSSLFVLPPNGGGNGTDPLIKIYGGHHGTPAALDAALAELTERAGVQPISSTTDDDSFGNSMRSLYGCGELTLDQCHRTGSQPGAQLYRTPYQRHSFQLSDRAATSAEIANLIAAYDAQAAEIPYRFIQVFALGGAANDVSPESTAYVHRSARFLLGFQSFDLNPQPAPEVVARHTTWTERAATALTPLSSGSYINFPSSRPDTDWGLSNYGSNYTRLRAVKKRYDPLGVFQHPGGIG
ncbi:FAD-binding protein [Streptomyces sp. NPDC006356]